MKQLNPSIDSVQASIKEEMNMLGLEYPLRKSGLKISNIKFIWAPNILGTRMSSGVSGSGILTFDITSNSLSPRPVRFKVSGFVPIGMFMTKTKTEKTECEPVEYEEDRFFFRPGMVASQLSEYMIASVLMSLIKFPIIEQVVSVSIPDIEVPPFNSLGESLNIDIFNFHQQSYDQMHDVFFKITSGVSVADGEILTHDEQFLKEEGLMQ